MSQNLQPLGQIVVPSALRFKNQYINFVTDNKQVNINLPQGFKPCGAETQTTIPVARFIPGVPSDPNTHAPDSGINKGDYLSLITAGKSPEEIAEEFNPEFDVYDHLGTFTPYTKKIKSIKELKKLGFGAIDPDSPKIKIHPNYYYTNRDVSQPIIYKDELIKVVYTGTSPHTTLYEFTLKYKTLYLAAIIAHELGHFVHRVNNNLDHIAWNLLLYSFEDKNVAATTPRTYVGLNGTNEPSYTGGGHLQGQPSGNAAARAEYEFCKALFEEYLWKEAARQIENKNLSSAEKEEHIHKLRFQNSDADIQSNNLHSYFLKEIFTQPPGPIEFSSFEIRDYLKGNIKEDIEIPKK